MDKPTYNLLASLNPNLQDTGATSGAFTPEFISTYAIKSEFIGCPNKSAAFVKIRETTLWRNTSPYLTGYHILSAQYIEELYKVIKHFISLGDNPEDRPNLSANSLMTSFTWEDTPQGFDFWARLHERIITKIISINDYESRNKRNSAKQKERRRLERKEKLAKQD